MYLLNNKIRDSINGAFVKMNMNDLATSCGFAISGSYRCA